MKKLIIIFGCVLFAATARFFWLNGLTNNTVLLAVSAAAVFFYGLFFEKLKTKKWLTFAIFLAFFSLLSLSGFLASYGSFKTVNSYDDDVIIVLGAGLNGEKISNALKARLDAALEYHAANPTAYLIVSGGQGPNESITEAEAMKRYLAERGVPERLVIKEEESYSTYTNIIYSKRIITEMFSYEPKIVIVTNVFHMYRAYWFANANGLATTRFPAKTPIATVPLAYVRECAAVVKMWVIKK